MVQSAAPPSTRCKSEQKIQTLCSLSPEASLLFRLQNIFSIYAPMVNAWAVSTTHETVIYIQRENVFLCKMHKYKGKKWS